MNSIFQLFMLQEQLKSDGTQEIVGQIKKYLSEIIEPKM